METSGKSPFQIRIFYAATPDLIRRAAASGYTHAVVHCFGHVRRNASGAIDSGKPGKLADDIPLFFNQYPALAAERRKIGQEQIIAVQNRIREKIALAAELGLKSIVASYELSLPGELERCCPDLFEGGHKFCLAESRHQQFLSDKITELFEVFPELDAYLFTAKEASNGIYYTHECDLCEHLSFAEKIDLLTRTLIGAKNKAKESAEIIFRLWGAEFPEDFYRNRTRRLWNHFGRPKEHDKVWLRSSWKDYSPETVLSEFARNCDPSLILCSKATWQDFDLRQNVNPWLGKFKNNREVIEISYESLGSAPAEEHFVLTEQIARFARHARRNGVAGLMALTNPFGYTEYWQKKTRSFEYRNGKGTVKINERKNPAPVLADITSLIAARLWQNPEADLKSVVREFFTSGFDSPPDKSGFCADLVMSIEKLAHQGINCAGLAVIGPNHYFNNNAMQLESYKDHACWSCCAADGDESLMRFLGNLDKVFSEKDTALTTAKKHLQALEAQAGQFSEKLYKFIHDSYAGFVDMLELNIWSQKIALPLWAVEQKIIPADERVCNFIANAVREKEKLLLQKPDFTAKIASASPNDRLYGFGGIQRYQTLKP